MSRPGDSYRNQVTKAASFISDICSNIPINAVQLGTGLGELTNRVEIEYEIPYEGIPWFPKSTVESHRGALLIGRLEGCRALILSGRFHYYEGYSTREITLPIRVLQLLGVKNLIITNAAGGLNPLFLPGTIMIIRDHLNFLGENPLRGPNVEDWGPRFPDFSEPYGPDLIKTALDSADHCRIDRVVTGTYACIPGPSLETPAETRWLRQCGADAVGMSSVPEVIIARHGSMRVLGLSLISNVNDPDNFQPILLEDIIAEGRRASARLQKLIVEFINRLDRGG
ncbi:MAG: purine-nucleoside phosphorylase [Desulfofustis sp.]|nr:purine-nucleoside phosphorylase [Desulfofustis sp.]NNK14566.1 purine-nucleoside phosphorylase [Desulfofustis sp.]NNK56359.1 purine-nucleoside phosphorylase [Desulfofustis sp.]